MRLTLLLVCILVSGIRTLHAQNFFMQYFDGADTSASSAIMIQLDTSSTNVWQIGKPQKSIFDSAATVPNAIVTDTLNPYPVNNVSRFSYQVQTFAFGPAGVLALQWKQKLDFDRDHDGGIIEFSVDSGQTWLNAFNTPYVYNFYGFDQSNVDTLSTGEYAFSGTDSTWRDIWLCFDIAWLSSMGDTVTVRYTMVSDSIDNQREGWIIDNMMTHITWAHTVKQMESSEYMKVFPTLTSGIINIEAEKLQEFHIIESIELFDMQGRVVQRHGIAPTKFYIDIKDHAEGMYYLKVRTNKKTETFPVVLKKG